MLCFANIGFPQMIDEELLRRCYRSPLVPDWKTQLVRYLLRPGNANRQLSVVCPVDHQPDRFVGMYLYLNNSDLTITVTAFIQDRVGQVPLKTYHFARQVSKRLDCIAKFLICCEDIMINFYEFYLSNIDMLDDQAMMKDWTANLNIANVEAPLQPPVSSSTSTCGFRQEMIQGIDTIKQQL